MNVTDMMKRLCGNEIYTAAYIMDQAEVEQIETSYQQAWDSGTGFTPSTMFRARGDDESEIEACANQMQGTLKDLITKRWLARYGREEILTLCGLLLKGPQHQYTRVCLVSDLELDAEDIIREWNDCHQDESPVYLPDPEYI